MVGNRALLATLLLALTACGTTVLPVAYTPTSAPSVHGSPVVADVTAIDARGESDPNWIGTIRGGYGNPIKTLDADHPVKDVVAEAVRRALAARDLLGGAGAPYRVQVTVEQLESDQMARREAKVRLHFTWLRGSGESAFENAGDADVVTGSLITLEAGVFGSVDELRATIQRALSQAIDKALDDPALDTFLRRNGR